MTAAEVSPASRLAPGTVLGDRFELEGLLGEGAMGVVYRALDRATDKPAAIKVLHNHLVGSREYVARFKREARAASRFRHPSAVRVLGSGTTDDRVPYIAMELVEGRSLKEVVTEDAPLAPGRACNIAGQLLSALGAAHQQGIVHRDMKPDNVRVSLDEDGIERPKILDFGVSKFVGDAGEIEGGFKTKTGVVLGTPKYMAPEQIRGEGVDGRADVYAVGAMLHELLTGAPPFEADDVFGFVAMHLKQPVVPITERYPNIDVPIGVDELVVSMLQKDPKDRPNDAAALAEELAPYSIEDPRAAEKGRALQRGMAVVAVAGVVSAVLAAVLAGSSGFAGAGAGLGLGIGAALAAKLHPRPSVHGYVKRVACVLGAVGLAAAVVSFLPGSPGPRVAVAHALAGLLSYVGYLLVWSSPAVWLRPVVAGVVAPLVATLLVPVRVVSEGNDPYYVGFLSGASERIADLERAARMDTLLAVAAVGVLFGLATLALPRPRAARID